MPVRSLKVPTEVRKVIRRLHPELKRKLRAALSDILDDPTCGKHSKRSLKDIGVCDWEEVESSIGSASAPSKREKGTGYFFSLPVKIKPGKSPLCREFLEDNKAATPITLLTAVTVAPRYSINLKTTKPFYRS